MTEESKTRPTLYKTQRAKNHLGYINKKLIHNISHKVKENTKANLTLKRLILNKEKKLCNFFQR